MTTDASAALDRRAFLKGGASLVFVLGATGGVTMLPLKRAVAQTVDAAARAIGPTSLDTWLSFDASGAVTAFFGKMDMGQGVDTAIAQVVAEELDVDVARVTVVMGDTHRTPNQGGASGSSGCRLGASALRNAAAEAKRVLVARASERLGVPAEALGVRDGTVFVTESRDRAVSYGDLIAEGFATELDWNGRYGNNLNITGIAKPKSPSEYRVVGTPVPRKDIAGKVLATTEFCHHVRLPGMLHARTLRPPVANAVPVRVDESSIAALPGARVIRKGDFIAVVAPSEWHAIKAARDLRVTWSETAPPFPRADALFEHIRAAPTASDSSRGGFGGAGTPIDTAPALAAIAAAPRRIEAEYEVPFQSHARMGPSVGVADVRDGEAIVYSDTQKSHDTRDGIAKILGLQPEKVRVIWKPGPGSYGRSDADEAAFEAAVISQIVGAPVRVQWMRNEGHGWDPKAPACVISCKAGLSAANEIAGWYFRAKGFSGWDVMFNASDPKDTLVGQLVGFEKGDSHNFGDAGRIVFVSERGQVLGDDSAAARACVAATMCAHASAAGAAAAFRARMLHRRGGRGGRRRSDRTALEAPDATNARSQCSKRSRARRTGRAGRRRPRRARGDVLRGRGVAINSGFGGYVATVCEVEVDRATGRVWPRRFFVAHDCGLIINPRGLHGTIEGNVVQGVSRTLFEEVRFDERGVTSVDWATYPILEVGDAPESIEIVTINRPEQPSGGAGEPAHVTIPAAIANAVFDATGVRMRRLPFTAERVKAALA